MVFFGAAGDLAQKKLIPSLFNLYAKNALPEKFFVVGAAWDDYDDNSYRKFVAETITKNTAHGGYHKVIEDFAGNFVYVRGDFNDLKIYQEVKECIFNYNKKIGQCSNILYYLAVPPSLYSLMFERLAQSESMRICDQEEAWAHLLVEKPFGRDIDTARELEEKLRVSVPDEQVYRIDHYLAKNAIENILALRFANPLLRNAWNAECVESIEINLSETDDLSNRGSFYDGVGALLDVGQNHLLQMLALLLMNEVDVSNTDSVREVRAKVLESLYPDLEALMIRGQYEGYRQTKGVASDSKTETFFQVSLKSNLPLWEGTRFVLRSGKALGEAVNEAVVNFRPVDLSSHGLTSSVEKSFNSLRLKLGPDQLLELVMFVRKAGFDFELEPRKYQLVADHEPDGIYSPDAYELVLLDCINGDQTRFVSAREVEAAWKVFMPIMKHFPKLPLLSYEPGSNGPKLFEVSNNL